MPVAASHRMPENNGAIVTNRERSALVRSDICYDRTDTELTSQLQDRL